VCVDDRHLAAEERGCSCVLECETFPLARRLWVRGRVHNVCVPRLTLQIDRVALQDISKCLTMSRSPSGTMVRHQDISEVLFGCWESSFLQQSTVKYRKPIRLQQPVSRDISYS